MSWQAYIDTQLVSTGKVSKGAIFGLDGSLWAHSPDCNIGAVEAKNLIAAFDRPDDIAATGLFLEGDKYVLLRNTDKVIYARKGAVGVCCSKTGQTVIVGFYSETMQAGACNQVVEGLAEYLSGTGY